MNQIFHVVSTVVKSGHSEQFLQELKKHRIIVHHDLIINAKEFIHASGIHEGQADFNVSARQMVMSPGGRCHDSSVA